MGVTTKGRAPSPRARSRESSPPFRWNAARCRAGRVSLAQVTASRSAFAFRRALLVGPAYRRVMAVLAGIVPAHSVIGEDAARPADRERQRVGRDRMAGRRPDFLVLAKARQRLHPHIPYAPELGRAGLARHK